MALCQQPQRSKALWLEMVLCIVKHLKATSTQQHIKQLFQFSRVSLTHPCAIVPNSCLHSALLCCLPFCHALCLPPQSLCAGKRLWHYYYTLPPLAPV